jgi:hypothetical protein
MKPEKPEPDAEQLLRMLDMQIAAKRMERGRRDNGRMVSRLLGILLVVGIALAALFALQLYLEQMPRPEPRAGVRQQVHP